MTKDEALKLALETLEYAGPSWIDARQPAITAIKEALAQPMAYLPPTPSPENACYTPLQRTWVGLTDKEILLISADCASSHQHMDIQFARAIEAKLKEKNT